MDDCFEKSEITVYINEGVEKVPISDAADILKHLQNVVYHIDAHLQGMKVTTQFQRSVVAESTLYFREISKGSLSADLSFNPYQTVIPAYVSESSSGSLPRLQQVVCIMEEIIQKTNEGFQSADAFKSVIDNSDRLYYIMSEIDRIWPDSCETPVSVRSGPHKISLNPENKENINIVLEEIDSQRNSRENKIYVGHVIDTSVNPRKILLSTPEGKVSLKYMSGLENVLKDALMKFIRVSVSGNEIKEKSDISECNEYALNSLSEKCRLSLKKPLRLIFSYDEECEAYFVNAGAFNLWTCSPSLKTAVAEINGHAEYLWGAYALQDNDNLEKSGQDLKKNLLDHLEEKE